MIIYKRHLGFKLFFLRLSIFVLLATGTSAFLYDKEKLGYFIVVVFLSLSVAVVRDFVVWPDSIVINKFYFFGLLKISFEHTKGQNIKISSYGPNFSEDADSAYFDDGGTGFGCLYVLISAFFPAKTIMKEFKIELINSHGDNKSLRIYLTKKEFDYLKQFAQSVHCR